MEVNEIDATSFGSESSYKLIYGTECAKGLFIRLLTLTLSLLVAIFTLVAHCAHKGGDGPLRYKWAAGEKCLLSDHRSYHSSNSHFFFRSLRNKIIQTGTKARRITLSQSQWVSEPNVKHFLFLFVNPKIRTQHCTLSASVNRVESEGDNNVEKAISHS